MTVRILYLDDDLAIVRLVQKALGRLGYEVVHAEDEEAALSRLAEGDFDAIVLDHYLRGITGHDVLRRFATENIQLPVVYVTGSNEASIAIEALKAGAADYVIKTVGDDFLPLLSSAIDQSIANAQLRLAKERAEEEIRRGKERAEALLAEVNHRVANSLALVASLLRLQISNSKSEDVKMELAETQARINAIAGMHRSLYTSDDVSRVEMDRYLGRLTSEIANSLQGSDNLVHLTLHSDPISISADQAVSVGMVVTELVTNAFKYAYPDGSRGEIRVRLKQIDPTTALLSVEDDGVGMSADMAPKGTGLGSRIIKARALSLGSGLVYQTNAAGGTCAEVPIQMKS